MTTTPNPTYDPNDDLWAQASNPPLPGQYIPPNYGKAITGATSITDRGCFHSLAHETREFLILTKKGRLARFLESLYFVGFKSGPITTKQAAELLLPIQAEKPVRVATTGKNQYTSKKPSLPAMYQRCLEPLEQLAALQDFFAPIIQDQTLFPPMPFEQEGKPSHRPEKFYYIPAAFVLNELIAGSKPTYIAMPARALDDDKTYKAFVWKKPVIEKGSVTAKQIDLCKTMNISRRTLKRYTFISGVEVWPLKASRRLSSREIARLPKNRKEQGKSKQHFKWVHDQSGAGARANLDDITRAGLNGHIYCNRRAASIFQDITRDAWIVQPTYIQTLISNPPAGENDLFMENAHLVYTVGKTDNKSPQQKKKPKAKRGKHATGSQNGP